MQLTSVSDPIETS